MNENDKDALTGLAIGAMLGSALGPGGAVICGLIGAIIGGSSKR